MASAILYTYMSRVVFVVAGSVVIVLLLLAVTWVYVWQPAPSPLVESDLPLDQGAFALGNYYFNQDSDPAGPYDLEKAKKYYRQALREDPAGHAMAWYQLGRVYYIQGHLYSAIYNFEQQIKYFGDTVPNVHYMLGLSYSYRALRTEDEADWQQAEVGFLEFMKYAPTSPWPRVDLAWVYFSQGKYDEMVPILEVGLEHYPDQVWLLNTYGLALLNLGNREAAKAVFEKALTNYKTLTVEDWAAAYSGNDPQHWNRNFELFGETIKYNLSLLK